MSKPKFSIIVVACNGVDLTVACVKSVLQYSDNFELIVVNSNTTDGTTGYLDSIAAGNPKIKIVEHTKDLTFAENNNLGLQVADGKFIVFLNNDTIVSKDWLKRMCVHFDNNVLPNIGMVGPVSSMSNGKQMVGVQDAERWYEENKGRWKHTGILYGWCVMAKREVIEKIGGFDQIFVNAYEDNDLCLRAQLAGYNLMIAYDTYIFHRGQGTLRNMMDIEKYSKNGAENRERYYDKWEDKSWKKLVAVYRTNGGEHLEESLEQTSKFADQIVIHFCRMNLKSAREIYVKNLINKFPKICKVGFYDGAFQEDYERNWLLQEALELKRQGRADWCISIDDDEIYEDKFIGMVQKLMHPRNPEVMGYICNWRTIWRTELEREYYRKDSTFGCFANYRFFKLIEGQSIFSTHPEGHHCGSAPIIAEENLRWISIRVKHLGYDTPEQRKKKFDFYQANDHFKTKSDIGYDDYSHLISPNPVLEEYEPDNGISLVCMVKDEEEFLLGMLENVQDLVDEYIIVDTGSTDKTLEIIENFKKHCRVPVKLFHYPWCDNYSIPRNFGKEQATQPWILMLDADERFRPEQLKAVMMLTESQIDVVVFNVLNYLGVEKDRNGNPVVAPTQSARLYRNRDDFYYTGIIHETIDDATVCFSRKGKLRSVLAPIELHHYGYLKGKKKVRFKMDYYEALNNAQIKVTDNKDPRPYFNLALHYMNDNKLDEAVKAFNKCLDISPMFWHASQHMASLNLQSAKNYLINMLRHIPQNHPAKKEYSDLLNYLDEKTRGFVKVD